jgi:hypothetical protein
VVGAIAVSNNVIMLSVISVINMGNVIMYNVISACVYKFQILREPKRTAAPGALGSALLNFEGERWISRGVPKKRHPRT